jgi:catechol 2,3-dioxygenase-like lactoylglutathione lyase family enzyme
MGLYYTDAIVTIATQDIDTLVNFYSDLLDKPPINFIPRVYAEFEFIGLKLGIFQPKENHNAEFQTSANSKISLCLEVNNLEAAIAHLTNIGYPPPGKIAIASHGREIYAYDPDGNRLILHQRYN